MGTEYESYRVTNRTMELMGLSDIDDIDKYIVVYNAQDNTKLDIVYTSGVKYEGKTYYTLSSLQSEIGEQT